MAFKMKGPSLMKMVKESAMKLAKKEGAMKLAKKDAAMKMAKKDPAMKMAKKDAAMKMAKKDGAMKMAKKDAAMKLMKEEKKVKGGGTLTKDSKTSTTFKGEAAIKRMMDQLNISRDEAVKMLESSKTTRKTGAN